MSADFAHMGIGYADTYWSQNFGASSSQGCS